MGLVGIVSPLAANSAASAPAGRVRKVLAVSNPQQAASKRYALRVELVQNQRIYSEFFSGRGGSGANGK
jgi:hypothetical protein